MMLAKMEMKNEKKIGWFSVIVVIVMFLQGFLPKMERECVSTETGA